jgi:hypothetical protein
LYDFYPVYEKLLDVDDKSCLFTLLAGNAEDEEAQCRRRNDLSDDSSKSTNTSNRKENEKEEIMKWEPDGHDSYIVESPDGESTLIF